MSNFFSCKSPALCSVLGGYPPGVFDDIVRQYNLTSNLVILDFGCGIGNISSTLARSECTVYAVEPESDRITGG